MYYGQDILLKSLNKVIKENPQKIGRNFRYKIIKNNNLYVKNYKNDISKQIYNEIIGYLEKIKNKPDNNFVLHKILLKIIIILKKILTFIV